MSELPFCPYDPACDAPAPASVPVTALVLTKDEEPNIARCLASLAWCDQILVVDSGSRDATAALASAAGAHVIEQPWLGFASQRQFALRNPAVRNEWVYFVDADEWVSATLAREVLAATKDIVHVAYRQRYRLVFQGRWIEHCGWYGGSWLVRLGQRSRMTFVGSPPYGERASVEGSLGTLHHDLVDEDLKGLAAWLRKHVTYAEAEAQRRSAQSAPLRKRWAYWRRGHRAGRPAARSLAKDVIFPTVPARPLALFLYMYVVRSGWRDGREGLTFCLLHAWFELVVSRLSTPVISPMAIEARQRCQPLVQDDKGQQRDQAV